MIGSHIGEYRILDLVGVGGMGEVYRAVHTKIGRVVAIKVMTRVERTPTFAERFVNEARIQSELSHPNIAALYDYTEIDGSPSIIMEYVDGRLLCDLIAERGTLEAAEALRVILDVAGAVAYVHARGVVHRDIKSNNIKISSAGQVKLLDFGIARAPTSRHLTDTGKAIGTVEYMSPEQISGGKADARSDVWALGVLLYEMLTGATPFAAENAGAMLKRILKGTYAPPSRLNPDTPRPLELIVARCLSLKPAARYASAGELADALSRLEGGAAYLLREGKKKAAALRAHVAPGARLSRRWLAVPAVALALALAASGYFLSGARKGEPEESSPGIAPCGQSAGGSSRKVKTMVDVNEGSAEVFVNGKRLGETPCTIATEEGIMIDLRLMRGEYGYRNRNFSVGKLDRAFKLQLTKNSSTNEN